MSIRCAIGWHKFSQFLLPSLPDGSLWPGQLQRTCDRCSRHEACYPQLAEEFFRNDWVKIERYGEELR